MLCQEVGTLYCGAREFPQSCTVLCKGDCSLHAFPGGSVVKNPPSNVGDTSFGYLGGEDSLEKEMATNSSIIAWKILWTWLGWGGGYSPWGHKESDSLNYWACTRAHKPQTWSQRMTGWMEQQVAYSLSASVFFFFFIYNKNKQRDICHLRSLPILTACIRGTSAFLPLPGPCTSSLPASFWSWCRGHFLYSWALGACPPVD